MVNEEQNQITINKIIELIYEMYLKDLKSNKSISNNYINSYGKICKKKGFINGCKNTTLF